MVVDTSLWGAMAADQRKDLVHTLVQFLKKQYPGCAPNVEVFNSSKRSVAKGKWSIWSGVPTVALK